MKKRNTSKKEIKSKGRKKNKAPELEVPEVNSPESISSASENKPPERNPSESAVVEHEPFEIRVTAIRNEPGKFLAIASNGVGVLSRGKVDLNSIRSRRHFAGAVVGRMFPGIPKKKWPENVWNEIEERLLKAADVPPGCPDAIPPMPESDADRKCPPPGVALDDPHWLACRFQDKYQSPEGLRLRYWRQEFYRWESGCYLPFSEDEVKCDLSSFIDGMFMRDLEELLRSSDSSSGSDRQVKLKVSVHLIRDVLQALKSKVSLPSDRDAPTWLCDSRPTPTDLVSMSNGILNIPALVDNRTDYLLPPTTDFFTLNRIECRYDPNFPEPVEWLKFLKQLWPNDPSSIDCLQEWFGYLLTPDISLHKILMVIGPPRSGKGTIARVVAYLVGVGNVVSPKLHQLGTRFGLQPLIGKTVAIVGEARLSERADAESIAEALLGISGGDRQTVDRKGLPPIPAKLLYTRFIVFGNELPSFEDASSALSGRLTLLKLVENYTDREDRHLENRLLGELPGILAWAIQGWERLRKNGQFTKANSAQLLRDQAEELVSPIKKFAQEWCELGADKSVLTADLYDAWRAWCSINGEQKQDKGIRQFGKKLFAAFPKVYKERPRENKDDRIRLYLGIGLALDGRNRMSYWRTLQEKKYIQTGLVS